MTSSDRYLDLLIDVLTRALFEDADEVVGLGNGMFMSERRRQVEALLARAAALAGLEIVRKKPYDATARRLGRDWPARAETMVGTTRLQSLRECVQTVLAEDVPGDLLEAGVWRGGGSVLMKAVLEAHGDGARTLWLADSFAGLPPPDPDYAADKDLDFSGIGYLSVSQSEVEATFRRYGLLDERVRFLPGWFADTLAAAPVQQLSVLRVDADLYSSTYQVLDVMHPKLAPGGFCIIDDYGNIRACRKAVHQYRYAHGIKDKIVDIDGWGVLWRRP